MFHTAATDGVLNRAIDEFDRLAVSLLALRNSSRDASFASSSKASSRANQGDAASSAPPSEMLVWIIDDYCAEMTTALSLLGVAPGNIRSWNNMRRSEGHRPSLLKDEKPDSLIINMPRGMRGRRPDKKYADLAACT